MYNVSDDYAVWIDTDDIRSPFYDDRHSDDTVEQSYLEDECAKFKEVKNASI